MLESLCQSVPSDATIAEGPSGYLLVLCPSIEIEIETSWKWNFVGLVEDKWIAACGSLNKAGMLSSARKGEGEGVRAQKGDVYVLL